MIGAAPGDVGERPKIFIRYEAYQLDIEDKKENFKDIGYRVRKRNLQKLQYIRTEHHDMTVDDVKTEYYDMTVDDDRTENHDDTIDERKSKRDRRRDSTSKSHMYINNDIYRIYAFDEQISKNICSFDISIEQLYDMNWHELNIHTDNKKIIAGLNIEMDRPENITCDDYEPNMAVFIEPQESDEINLPLKFLLEKEKIVTTEINKATYNPEVLLCQIFSSFSSSSSSIKNFNPTFKNKVVIAKKIKIEMDASKVIVDFNQSKENIISTLTVSQDNRDTSLHLFQFGKKYVIIDFLLTDDVLKYVKHHLFKKSDGFSYSTTVEYETYSVDKNTVLDNLHANNSKYNPFIYFHKLILGTDNSIGYMEYIALYMILNNETLNKIFFGVGGYIHQIKDSIILLEIVCFCLLFNSNIINEQLLSKLENNQIIELLYFNDPIIVLSKIKNRFNPEELEIICEIIVNYYTNKLLIGEKELLTPSNFNQTLKDKLNQSLSRNSVDTMSFSFSGSFASTKWTLIYSSM